MKWKDIVLECLFPMPSICVLCEKKTSKIGICDACLAKYGQKRLRYGYCQRCGTFGSRSTICNVCRQWPKYMLKVVALWPYDELVKNSISSFKYKKEPWRVRGYEKAIKDAVIKLEPKPDIVLAIPLHKKRLNERSYNQSMLVSEILAKQIDCEHGTNVLIRRINTPRQVGLTKAQRHINLIDAFVVDHADRVKEKNILLVDDVLTTGSTIEACARVLNKAGAKSIQAFVLATSHR